MILRLLFALAVLSLAACATTTIDSLTPGTPLGTTERGVMKTTTGLSLTVRSRSYDQVWAAADSAMAQAVTAEAGQVQRNAGACIDDDKARGVIRSAVRNPLGATRAYVGIFVSPVTPAAPAYVVSVSQKLESEARGRSRGGIGMRSCSGSDSDRCLGNAMIRYDACFPARFSARPYGSTEHPPRPRARSQAITPPAPHAAPRWSRRHSRGEWFVVRRS